jgi:hypothetical protein
VDASDVVAAERIVAACGRPVEILSERTEYAQTFLNPDGSRTLEEAIEPVRVRRGASWVPVDTTLKARAGGVEPRATVLPVAFSDGGDGPMARLRHGAREIGITWPGRLPAPVVKGDTAVYREVLPGADLRVTARALGFSHVLVVRTRRAAADPRLASLRFGLATKGVTVAATKDGGLSARDGQGRVVFTASAPLMWDSSADAAAAARPADGSPSAKEQGGASGPAPKPSAGVRTGEPAIVVPAGARRAVMPVRVEGGTLTVTPDRRMLTDPGAKLPIYIDPAWTGSISGSAWTSVWSKHKSSSFWKNSTALTNGKTYGSAGSGRTEDCTGCADHIIRSLFRMDTATVRGKQILDAKFRIEQKHSWTCNPKSNAKLWMTGSISSGTTWNKQPTWYSSPAPVQTAANRKVGSAHGCAGAGTIEFNTTAMVRHAAERSWTTLTLGLRAVSESTLNQWKRFNHASPKLAIRYNTAPAAPGSRTTDAKACATGAARPYVRTLTPTMAAKHSDPDADQGLTTTFYYWSLGGSRNETNKVSQAAGNNSPVSRPVPVGKLADGGTYVWQARTADGNATGAFAPACEFTVDVTAPAVPASVTSASYPPASPDNAGQGGVGIAGQFTIAAPAGVGDVAGYAWTAVDGVEPTAANQVTGTSGATITYLPVKDGVNTLRVWTKDRAGWYSPAPFTYTFKVRPGAGPAAEWTFDEISGAATDGTGHGNTAALSAAATRTPGRSNVGSALALNGTNAAATLTGPVMAPHPDSGISTAVRTDSSVTLSAWVRLAATGGTAQRVAVSINGAWTGAATLGYSGPDNRWRFAMAGADADNPASAVVLSTAAPTANRWTHVAGVYDASTRRLILYVNGVAQTATATLTGGFNAAGSVTVGKRRWNNADDGFLQGAVDDVRISGYSVPQSALALLAAPLPPAVTFPDGDMVPAGQPMAVRLDAGADTNVTSYRYSVGAPVLDLTATPDAAGGPATFSVPTSAPGSVTVYAAAVDAGGNRSQARTATFQVSGGATLTGVVIDGDTAEPVAGAIVTLTPGGRTATTGADGEFTVAGLAVGTYTVTASHGLPCGRTGTMEVDVEGEVWVDLVVFPVTDGLGHICAEQALDFAPADATVLALTGDDAVTRIDLPFAFPFYGASYREAWVDTNGVVAFDDPGGSHPYPGGALPTAAEPSNLVAPFWDDLVVDGSASVRTARTGSDVDERLIVEWRNVHRKGATTQRLSFQVILAADGTVTTNYAGLDGDLERGAQAAVGIEAPGGEDGLTFSAGRPALDNGRAVVFDHPGADRPIDVYDLSGTLLDQAGAPVVGATVTLDPSGLSTTTTAGGAWRFDDLVADSYTVSSASAGRCGRVARDVVELSADTAHTLRLAPDHGGLGYACATGTASFVAAGTVLALTGDDAASQVTTPFPLPFHGRSYTSAWIHTNGLVSFGEAAAAADAWANPTMPTGAAPNAVVAPFWEDLNVDASGSVRTATQGTAPNRAYVVEWRNVLLQGLTSRVTFEVIFHEDGRIAFHYGAMSTPPQHGAGATVGLESASGMVAALYSFQEAALTPNGSITYTPAPAGTLGGTLTEAVTGEPAAGRTVTLDPGGLTATTAADGGFSFAGLPVGEYTVAATTGNTTCAGQYASEAVAHAGGGTDVDLSVMSAGDEFGYRCTSGAQTFVAGNVVEDWSGDETVWQKNPPFPVKLYGNTYTSAWISANGLLTFKDPAFFGWIGSIPGPVPSTAADGVPNAAVYVHWDDWVVDAQADIATRLVGSAPNRRWVVEWRNVVLFDDPAARASFEVIFDEGGGITFAYADIDPARPLERGSGALVGIENAEGTIGYQYAFKQPWLASGQGQRFEPSPPGVGKLRGSVTCESGPVSGATVTVGGRTATTGADGTYEVTGVSAGTHAVIATVSGGACAGSAVAQATLGTNTDVTVDFPTAAAPAGAGYALAEQVVPSTAAGAALPLSGDDAFTPVTLPFPVRLYGQTYPTAWVDTNGLVTFADPGEPSPDAWPIPSPESPQEPNAAAYPFWHDWVVDSSASVRTATVGTAPNRRYIIEWRNVHSYEDPQTRVSFEVILHEGGAIEFAYADVDGTFLELGGGATIGIENADGTRALQYTYRQPVLPAGLGLRFTPPAS